MIYVKNENDFMYFGLWFDKDDKIDLNLFLFDRSAEF